jgi:hypothetical protein
MNYVLIYKDGRGTKMAAIPDKEGVYKTKINFSDFKEDITSIEVLVMEVENPQIFCDCGEEEYEYIEGEIVGKMVASKKISECIKKLGFEKFFTTMIKQFIKKEANL